MSLLTGKSPLLNVYLNDMQTKKWLQLSSGLWGTPLRSDLFRRIDQKNFSYSIK